MRLIVLLKAVDGALAVLLRGIRFRIIELLQNCYRFANDCLNGHFCCRQNLG